MGLFRKQPPSCRDEILSCKDLREPAVCIFVMSIKECSTDVFLAAYLFRSGEIYSTTYYVVS